MISIYNPTNLEELDDLEGTELAIQNATSVLGLVEQLLSKVQAIREEGAEEFVDVKEIKNFIHKLLKNTGSMAHNIFKTDEEDTSKEPPEESV